MLEGIKPSEEGAGREITKLGSLSLSFCKSLNVNKGPTRGARTQRTCLREERGLTVAHDAENQLVILVLGLAGAGQLPSERQSKLFEESWTKLTAVKGQRLGHNFV